MECGNCEYLCKEGYKCHPPRCDKYFPNYGELLDKEVRNAEQADAGAD